MAQEKHGWDDQNERDRDQNENPNNEENEGQNALRNSTNGTSDENTMDENEGVVDEDRADEAPNSTEGLNQREDETEPFDQDDDEGGQGSTTGEDYGTRQANSVGEGGTGRNSNEQDTEQNRKDLSDRGEDEGNVAENEE